MACSRQIALCVVKNPFLAGSVSQPVSSTMFGAVNVRAGLDARLGLRDRSNRSYKIMRDLLQNLTAIYQCIYYDKVLGFYKLSAYTYPTPYIFRTSLHAGIFPRISFALLSAVSLSIFWVVTMKLTMPCRTSS